jgi:hypothetical protein
MTISRQGPPGKLRGGKSVGGTKGLCYAAGKEEILRRLSDKDIIDLYERGPFQATQDAPGEGGWLRGRYGDGDRHPSAAINLTDGQARGRYKDHSGKTDKASLFDYLAEHVPGQYGPRQEDAVRALAAELGIELVGGGKGKARGRKTGAAPARDRARGAAPGAAGEAHQAAGADRGLSGAAPGVAPDAAAEGNGQPVTDTPAAPATAGDAPQGAGTPGGSGEPTPDEPPGAGAAGGDSARKKNRLPPDDIQQDWKSQIRFVAWRDELVAGYLAARPPIAGKGILDAGGFLGYHQKNFVLAFPVLAPDLELTGWVVAAADGKGIPCGKESPKVKTIKGSKSGLIGYSGVTGLKDARTVIKVEGLSDLLSLLSQGLPEGVVAMTNAGGASEDPKPAWVEAFTGKEVVIVHDCDKPGQDGAKKWVSALAEVATVRNVQLGFPITEKHGKDLKDWLNSGKTLGDLLQLIEQTPEGPEPEPWGEAEPLDATPAVPDFLPDTLPSWLAEWVAAEAEAMQVPVDLPAMLVLAVCGAALAKKFVVAIRPGWSQPPNLYTVVSLPSGDRKSSVFRDVLAPVLEFEQREAERMAPEIARAASARRVLEGRVKKAEERAAREAEEIKRQQLEQQARDLAAELARCQVPERPRLACDDITPEKLANLLAKHGGRMLQAAPEGTLFEIVRGRYSEMMNLDIWLKGYSGDDHVVDRVGRPSEVIRAPAVSLALAVQPDVLHCLGEETRMKGRGFLARFLYSLPRSLVGTRVAAAEPVSPSVARAYAAGMLALWATKAGENGNPHTLAFSPEADQMMQAFETWLEPQLAEGDQLADLFGWPAKLAGAAARIAGVLHVADAVTVDPGPAEELADPQVARAAVGSSWQEPISADTLVRAIRLAQSYFLPHALAAFDAMGANAELAKAKVVWATICRRVLSESHENSESAPPCFSRRDAHQWNRRQFPGGVEELDPVLGILIERNLM